MVFLGHQYFDCRFDRRQTILYSLPSPSQINTEAKGKVLPKLPVKGIFWWQKLLCFITWPESSALKGLNHIINSMFSLRVMNFLEFGKLFTNVPGNARLIDVLTEDKLKMTLVFLHYVQIICPKWIMLFLQTVMS